MSSPLPVASAAWKSSGSSLAVDPPRFDLGFDKVQQRMEEFLTNLSRHVAKGRQQIMNDKNDYTQQMSDLQGKNTKS